MAVAFGSATTGSTASGTSITIAVTITGTDPALVVKVSFYAPSGERVSGVTCNGVAMVQVDNTPPVAPDGVTVSDMWVLSNPATGNVVISFTGNVAAVASAERYTGAHQTTASLVGTSVSATGTSSTPTLTLTSATGELGVDNLADFLATESPDTGTESYDLSNANIGGAGSYRDGAASLAMPWTLSGSADWAQLGVPIKPSAGGATTAGPLIRGGSLIHGALIRGGRLVA